MPLRIAQLTSDDKFCQRLSLPVMEQLYARELVCEILSDLQRWEKRERKLNQVFMVYLLIAWHLFLNQSLRAVCLRLSAPLRLLGDLAMSQLPSHGALIYRRKQLGVRVLRQLMRRVCKPLATPQTPGAYALGYHLMAIDGTREDVADTPANTTYFGRLHSGDTASPYPQISCVYLAEVGTHAIVDAIPAPSKANEQRLCWGLLPRISEGMLVLLDKGFVSGAFMEALGTRGAQVLARLSKGLFLKREKVLADGSYLTTLTPQMCHGLKQSMQVRIIEYRIKPAVADLLVAQPPSRMHSHSTATNPRIGEVHRLVTTLLDPQLAPALDLCLLYHERWEIELCIDEIKDHQRISEHPLRSRLPVLALQELYALLLAHYLVRAVLFRAAISAPQPLDPDRLSFTIGIQVLSDALIVASLAQPHRVDVLIQRLGEALTDPASLLAPRRLRFNCRVVKHICTRFRRKRPRYVNLTLKHTRFADLLLI